MCFYSKIHNILDMMYFLLYNLIILQYKNKIMLISIWEQIAQHKEMFSWDETVWNASLDWKVVKIEDVYRKKVELMINKQ